MKLPGDLKVIFEAFPTKLSYAELTTKGVYFHYLFLENDAYTKLGECNLSELEIT